MNDESNKFVYTNIGDQEQAVKLMEKLFTIAQPGAVYSEPVVAEGQTVITASEVSVGMGFGFGSGYSSRAERAEDEPASDETDEMGGGGSGGGGGGMSAGRPVAVISIGPEGVRVDPVVDVTKIGLAFFTMLGSIFMIAGKMRKGSLK